MKNGIHPEYKKIMAVCACGKMISIKSTLKQDIVLDVCYVCHPFYTGKQRIIDSRGRVNRFNKRYNMTILSK